MAMKQNIIIFSAVAALTVLGNSVQADIYRVVGKDGKVTYTDQPPENANAENIQQRIDQAVQRNTTESLETQRENEPEWVQQAREERAEQRAEDEKQRAEEYLEAKKVWQTELKRAKQKLKDAIREQEAGREVVDGDFIGKAGGGARPSEQYLGRQLMLEEKVKDAEKMLAKIRKSKPKKP